MSVIYKRAIPCRVCGSHEFYALNRLCRACCKARSKAYRIHNSTKIKELQRAWSKENAVYVRVYRRARAERLREALPAIFAVYLMTRGEA